MVICNGFCSDQPHFGTRDQMAAEKYVHEVVLRLKHVLELPVDAYTPPVPPWD
jgi:hypothetical protein